MAQNLLSRFLLLKLTVAILDVIHPPNLGPALHIHPKGSETFYIVEGDYEFILNRKSVTGKTEDVSSSKNY